MGFTTNSATIFSVSHYLEVNDMALYYSRVYHFFYIHYAPVLH